MILVMTHETEDDLVARIKSGDSAAWPEYLECVRESLRGFINKNMSSLLQKRVDADDILQETFVSCLNSANEMDWSEGNVFGWVCQQARRRIADAGRHASAQKRDAKKDVSIDANPSDGEHQQGIVNLLVASITSPSRAFSRNQRELQLLTALDTLPSDQQEALKLRYVEGLPTKEIAKRIGKSDGALRVMLTRSLKKLEQALSEMNS